MSALPPPYMLGGEAYASAHVRFRGEADKILEGLCRYNDP